METEVYYNNKGTGIQIGIMAPRHSAYVNIKHVKNNFYVKITLGRFE